MFDRLPTATPLSARVRPTAVFLNPNAGSFGQAGRLREALRSRPHVVVVEPGGPDELPERVADALADGREVLVAAGGDGTVHRLLNALAPDFGRACLAVLPLGTGNDLRRTLGIPDDPLEALAVLDACEERRLDVIAVDAPSGVAYCLNVASGGFSGQVRETLTDDVKAIWGPLAYLRGAAEAIADLSTYRCRLEFDNGDEMELDAVNITVANCRFAAKGWQVASRANPEDGLLDVLVVRDAPLVDLAGVAADLLAGDYADSEPVLHRRSRWVRVVSEPPMAWSVDGEPAEGSPVTFSVLPGAVRMIVGPAYDPEPAV
jgi:diacylglycerol kinase (ATP)